MKYIPIILCLALCACGQKNRPDFMENVNIGRTADAVSENAEKIEDTAQDTTDVADDWQRVAPSDEHWSKVVENLSTIRALANAQWNAGQALIEAQKELEKERASSGKVVAKLEAELREAREESAKWESRIYLAAIAAGVGMVVAGIVLSLLFKAPAWLSLSAAGVATTSFGKFMLSGGWLIPVLGGAILIALAAFAGYLVWLNRKKIAEDAANWAQLARSVLSDDKPESVRELIAALRTADPALNKAMKQVTSEPKGTP